MSLRARHILRALAGFGALALVQGAAAQEGGGPLSAIDWLSEGVQPAAAAPRPGPRVLGPEPPVADLVQVPQVMVTPLDSAASQPAGLFAPSSRNLPQRLWEGSAPDTLIALIEASPPRPLPALAQLQHDLMLARAAPPREGGGVALLIARADQLFGDGAAAEALALLDASASPDPEVFRRRFDAALLTGTEQDACATMEADPRVAPDWPARVFCLARSGDWPAAALTLGTARALGDISETEDALLSRFLDPDLYEGLPPPPLPARLSPLEFRMREAIGAPVPTGGLPLAFAAADLRHHVGWKSRIEAGERLARAGAIAPETLLALYREGRPSASGGVWQRVAAIQALDTALTRSDAEAAAQALPAAWAAMREARVEVAMATLWGGQVDRMGLPGAAGALAHRMGLLSPAYGALARPDGSLADSIARGEAPADSVHADPRITALSAGFGDTPPPSDLMALAESDRAGEAILLAIARFESGFTGAPEQMREALALLRALGLEQTARRTALQALLLERTP